MTTPLLVMALLLLPSAVVATAVIVGVFRDQLDREPVELDEMDRRDKKFGGIGLDGSDWEAWLEKPDP